MPLFGSQSGGAIELAAVPPDLLEKYLKKLFETADLDGNGVLDRAEFGFVLRQSGLDLGPQRIMKAMEAADTNGDGVIQYDEFVPAMLQLLGKRLPPAPRPELGARGGTRVAALTIVGKYAWVSMASGGELYAVDISIRDCGHSFCHPPPPVLVGTFDPPCSAFGHTAGALIALAGHTVAAYDRSSLAPLGQMSCKGEARAACGSPLTGGIRVQGGVCLCTYDRASNVSKLFEWNSTAEMFQAPPADGPDSPDGVPTAGEVRAALDQIEGTTDLEGFAHAQQLLRELVCGPRPDSPPNLVYRFPHDVTAMAGLPDGRLLVGPADSADILIVPACHSEGSLRRIRRQGAPVSSISAMPSGSGQVLLCGSMDGQVWSYCLGPDGELTGCRLASVQGPALASLAQGRCVVTPNSSQLTLVCRQEGSLAVDSPLESYGWKARPPESWHCSISVGQIRCTIHQLNPPAVPWIEHMQPQPMLARTVSSCQKCHADCSDLAGEHWWDPAGVPFSADPWSKRNLPRQCVDCPLGCGLRPFNCCLERHVLHECPHRLEPCGLLKQPSSSRVFCNRLIRADAMSHHQANICPYRQVDCPLGCTVGGESKYFDIIPRPRLQHWMIPIHTESECPVRHLPMAC